MTIDDVLLELTEAEAEELMGLTDDQFWARYHEQHQEREAVPDPYPELTAVTMQQARGRLLSEIVPRMAWRT